MILKSGKWFGWLAGLALVPVVEGQEIIEHPQDATVCVGESAEVKIVITGGALNWQLNGSSLFNFITLLPYTNTILGIEEGFPSSIFRIVGHDEQITGFNNTIISGRLGSNPYIFSKNATVIYKTSRQFIVPRLIPIISNTTAQFEWDAHNSNLTTQYLFGVYDSDGNLLGSQTTNATHASFELPPRADNTCQYLEFRVTAEQCPDPENGFSQTEGATFVYREPDIDISPVTAEFDNDQTVWVSWTPAGNGMVWVSVIDLDRGDAVQVKHGNPPFSYTPVACGQHSLNVSVSPAECPDEPGFTYSSNSISFTIPCPTTVTEVAETEGQPSGTQALYPSLLLAVAATIPLLKWQH